MIPRRLSKNLLKYAQEHPILALVGLRQSGKTTLTKALFPKHKYVSLENLDLRHQATIERWFQLDENPDPAKKGLVVYCRPHTVQKSHPIPAIPWYML